MSADGSPKKNPTGSPFDAKKRSSTSAELMESPSKRRGDDERSYPNIAEAFKEYCSFINKPFTEEIMLPLYKAYQDVMTRESPSRVPKRKLDMSSNETESQKSAGVCDLSVPSMANLNLSDIASGPPSVSSEKSDRSDVYPRLYVNPDFREKCHRFWKTVYQEILAAEEGSNVNLQGLSENLDVIRKIFRKFVYIDTFFAYNGFGSEPTNSRKEFVLENKEYEKLDIPKEEFNAELISSCKDEEFLSKFSSLWDKEEIILRTALEETKALLINLYKEDGKTVNSKVDDLAFALDALLLPCLSVHEICVCLKKIKLPTEKSSVISYFDLINSEIESSCESIIGLSDKL